MREQCIKRDNKIEFLSQEAGRGTPGPPGEGKVKSEYYSDNSASLPGLMGTQGPVGFEPGMFKKDADDHKQKGDSANKATIKNKIKHKSR